jgi:ribosomal protein S18 acetylase RimI-like enzyme
VRLIASRLLSHNPEATLSFHRRMTKSRMEIALGEMTDKNVGAVRVLNENVFPVHYGDAFYANLPKYVALSQLAFVADDMLVGAVACRREGPRLYIMTLGVLTPYRRLGVGCKLLHFVFETLVAKQPDVVDVFLHVQVNNDAALAFYAKHGFVRGAQVDGYYKNVQPDAAFLLTCTPAQWAAAHPEPPAPAAPAPAPAAAPAAVAVTPAAPAPAAEVTKIDILAAD